MVLLSKIRPLARLSSKINQYLLQVEERPAPIRPRIALDGLWVVFHLGFDKNRLGYGLVLIQNLDGLLYECEVEMLERDMNTMSSRPSCTFSKSKQAALTQNGCLQHSSRGSRSLKPTHFCSTLKLGPRDRV
ncbi:hypothetical protein BDF20DRAFT_831999 [Mycotypha africana]|uniref:uncharacterized protein n=1 Tax=Mycotypha africana TaxID=64632 RepID=UPI002300BF33|nr:uncharacterized protein BDF20DRAFT_831999 [Mycotypha africana]KAI8992011.1 hypothetical protein BDF20DRAFT_831999 [Mycotypha africana]